MSSKITFDIETIPQRSSLTIIQQEELQKKLKRIQSSKTEPIDIEAETSLIMGTSPYFGEIITIGLLIVDQAGNSSEMALIGDEQDILKDFWGILQNHRLATFISYNGLTFDVPFIVKRSMKWGITPTCPAFLNTKRFQKYPHFDAKDVISDFDKFAAPSLRLACDLVGIPSPKEEDIKAENVAQAFAQGRIREIAEYCKRDVVATYELYKRLQGYFI